ncbi:MAG: ribonuclease R [Oligoflexia bacterium]|nr:ribonuclease R [Oligoflexia bacterium]
MQKDRKNQFTFRDRSGKIHGRPGEPEQTTHQARSKPKKFTKGAERAHETKRTRPPQARPHQARGERKRGHDEETRLKATVDKNQKGFGFLIFEDRKYEDAFVPPRDAEAFFHGDRVEVTLNGRGEVVSIDVLEHRFREVVGRFSVHSSGMERGGWVVYERKRAREEVFIPGPVGPMPPANQLLSGDWVKAKLTFHSAGPFAVTGALTETYGPELPPSADIGMVAAEYNLVEKHSERAESEAREFKLEIPSLGGREGRVDLRETPFITIDGETARDFDDAVFVEREKSGYILWVAIADVSHYVSKGTALDQEALSRGTSVYFPERAFHMLPRALSENLCSLRPHEPRLALVAKMHFDRSGDCTKTELMEALIESKRRATYNEIQAEFEKHGKSPAWEYAPHFELYQIIRRTRSERGSIDFDLPEAELIVKPTGEVVSITQRARIDAHRLIEEFMIAANEAVTAWMMERQWPFVYRVHDEPSQEALGKFQKLAANVGIVLKMEGGSASPKVLADAIRKLEGHPAQLLLNDALLRSMKRAIYSSVHGVHYGLASEGYTHFTSPIRRYPDLVVHRLIRLALRVEKEIDSKLSANAREELETELAEICEHCSYRERIASDAERESIKLKQVRAMIPEVGNEFDGEITGMMESGFFVKVPNPYCEGMVSRDLMDDDFYEFDEERMVFFGRRRGHSFRIGDKVRVRCLRAEIDRRQIDFGLCS